MKFTAWLFLVFLLIGSSINGQNNAQTKEEPDFKLFLVGDAGDRDITGETLTNLKRQLQNNPNSAVVFLGDNCYLNTFPLPVQLGGFNGKEKSKSRMMSQLNILRDYKGYAYIIPGNHDWWNDICFKLGKKRLLMEQFFVEDTLRSFKTIQNHLEGTFLPVNGNPGPVSKDYNAGKIRIIFLDTYRIIIEESKKMHRDTSLLNSFYRKFNEQVKDASNKNQKIIVAAHHPIHAKGKHSQPLKWWEKLSRHFEDSNSNYPPYHRMAFKLDSMLKTCRHSDVYYVSGHEHSLEYLNIDGIQYITSGAGSKVDKVNLESKTNNEETLIFNKEGYFVIDFYKNRESVSLYYKEEKETEMTVPYPSVYK
ncbi:MAG TPA: metallophosphoesterase [Saprospiraceae bacterium]|nr:metallophosphoesterase [Saprospiraceae bacterium]